MRVPPFSRLILIGGSALNLLGYSRPTVDIDFIGDDVKPNEFHQTLMRIAKEMQIHIEAVPLERFVPLPKGNEERAIRIGQFGNLEIYVADPYSIALSKLDRGLDKDLEDILFLIQHNHIEMRELEHILEDALATAGKFDFHPEILSHLQELKSRIR